MAGTNPDIRAIQKVELAVGQCQTLSILPAVAARFFGRLGRMELTPSSLAELVESDPALTILVLRLCQDKKITINKPDYWILQALEKLSLREVRDAMLSASVYGGLAEDRSSDFRRELTLHSLATACCAEQLVKLMPAPLDGTTAYLAGLLHDTGKFLLDETMPKSFDTLLEQARAGKKNFSQVERENLGTDHTILGKRFAQRTQLPADIILGIWLHHSQTGAMAMPQARIAAVVELADGIVRKAGIGDSGSYDDTPVEQIAETLGLKAEQINEVAQRLPELVRQKSEVAGLTLLKPVYAYCDALRLTTGQLAEENAKLFDESGQLQSNASNFDFVRELLPKINSTIPAIETARDFAINWQRFYQTGPVCVYLISEPEAKSVEAVVVESATKTKADVLDVPAGVSLIPEPMREKFAVLDSKDNIDWLLEQAETTFDLSKTKLVPLQAGIRTVGIIVFELRHPIGSTLRPGSGQAGSPQVGSGIEKRFEPAARLGGMIFDILAAIREQQGYAERFAQAMASGGRRAEDRRQKTEGGGQNTEDRGRKTDVGTLAEMAAGAAHEMNNPLSVIRGRAQLLAGSENDPEKKRMLEQIQANGQELSAIIDDLMSYANPEKPRPTETAVRQIIDEAADLARQKRGINQLDIKVDISPDLPKVFVDSAQIDIALSNIICNAIESYDGQTGTVMIEAIANKDNISIKVTDSGRGMDEATLGRATQPFFSAKPAGRKRGMGLAHAQRLVEINDGTMTLASRPGKGTTAMVILPYKV